MSFRKITLAYREGQLQTAEQSVANGTHAGIANTTVVIGMTLGRHQVATAADIETETAKVIDHLDTTAVVAAAAEAVAHADKATRRTMVDHRAERSY